ncbi:MAG TPA: enoyl-CoA hydratase/isomerase family protein [Pseudolabrys sp.]|jgi:enoyl-CoA hydratase|nr:enoyl-CoA hydratase/isomerase family protein [Pseudolabrys sp.]
MISLEVADSVATLTLCRPPVNAISNELIKLFEERLDEIEAQPDCKVVHLRSDEKVFCAGADLTEVRQRFDAPDGSELTYHFVSDLQQLYDRIERLPQVTLAEIAGAAVGGGLELALACDLRIVATDARIGLPEIGLGLIPAGGGTQRLTRLCGRAIAARLIFGAEVLVGADAVELGLAQWVAPRADIAARAREIVQRIASFPAAALRSSKKCIAAADHPDDRGYAAERETTRRLSSNPETRARVAAFLAGDLR